MVKGDSGLKICTECRNMYTERSRIVDEENNECIASGCMRYSEIDFANVTDVPCP